VLISKFSFYGFIAAIQEGRILRSVAWAHRSHLNATQGIASFVIRFFQRCVENKQVLMSIQLSICFRNSTEGMLIIIIDSVLIDSNNVARCDQLRIDCCRRVSRGCSQTHRRPPIPCRTSTELAMSSYPSKIAVASCKESPCSSESRLKEQSASSRHTVPVPFKSHATGFRKIRIVCPDHVRLGHRATLLLRERETICIAQHAQ